MALKIKAINAEAGVARVRAGVKDAPEAALVVREKVQIPNAPAAVGGPK
ncbi:MAG: hypothetical protein ACLFUU_03290 [Desulfobacteraceae bacterium]